MYGPVFSSLWRYSDNPTIAAPVDGKWRWNTPTYDQMAFAGLDDDGTDRVAELAALQVDDRIHLRNTTTADNWAVFDIVAVDNQTTWVRFDVVLAGTGTVAGLPTNNQTVLVDFLRSTVSTFPTVADVERVLGVEAGSVDAGEVQVSIDEVADWADRHVKAEHIAAPTAELSGGLAKMAADNYRWKNSPNGWSGSDDMVPVPVRAYDPRVTRQLSGYLITAGLFGPSANTDET